MNSLRGRVSPLNESPRPSRVEGELPDRITRYVSSTSRFTTSLTSYTTLSFVTHSSFSLFLPFSFSSLPVSPTTSHFFVSLPSLQSLTLCPFLLGPGHRWSSVVGWGEEGQKDLSLGGSGRGRNPPCRPKEVGR